MNRWKASAFHLGISALVAALVVGVMLKLWYPPPYFDAMGGATLLILIVGCDVVLGPLITLIVFKAGKKGLKMDLTLVGCLQLAALCYGSYTIFLARPVFTVFAVDRFEVVAANDIRAEELARATDPEFSSLSLTGPRLVAAKLPSNPDEQLTIMLGAMQGGDDVKQMPRLYVPYPQAAQDVARHSKAVSVLSQHDKSSEEAIRELALRTGSAESELGFLPLNARNQNMSVIVDRRSGNVEGILPINPW